MKNKLRRKVSRGIKFIKEMSMLSAQQSLIVTVIAFFCFIVALMSKAFYIENSFASGDNFKSCIKASSCSQSHEILIPIAYMASTSTLTVSSIGEVFADTENLSFQV